MLRRRILGLPLQWRGFRSTLVAQPWSPSPWSGSSCGCRRSIAYSNPPDQPRNTLSKDKNRSTVDDKPSEEAPPLNKENTTSTNFETTSNTEPSRALVETEDQERRPRRGLLAELPHPNKINEGLPEELHLPVPADGIKRIVAGGIDLCIAAAAGLAVASSMHYGFNALGLSSLLGPMSTLHSMVHADFSSIITPLARLLPHKLPEVVWEAGAGTALLTWVLRDVTDIRMTPNTFSIRDRFHWGNRSLGKRWMGIELTYWDGTPVRPSHAAIRSWYFFSIPWAASEPVAAVLMYGAFLFDAASVVTTDDARKWMDYFLKVYVVQEKADRESRMEELEELEEMAAIKREIDELEGVTLAERLPFGSKKEDAKREEERLQSLAAAERKYLLEEAKWDETTEKEDNEDVGKLVKEALLDESSEKTTKEKNKK